jgi:hypothetical protein
MSERLHKTIGHGRTISDIPDVKIKLPIDKQGEINFEYMKHFIQKLPFAEMLMFS